ncbi:hypothetical protein C922_02022 [Plasmodium inui San Antonio 1]|uniref:Plasmodium RESA N-terminal domain-containing protein n=1 Tax=Plasmodium inui San Antonio 1 TaxID=1237626 RepID=W7A990_9APIC|nr:hypothetical protein C922_02022 [Plasmodium inui San Antonio 1]EUD67833.1 hypothetical protein C922_02022 [Plasmodium inui San Antonio 1]
MTNEDEHEGAEESLVEITDDMYDNLQRSGNTTEEESTELLFQIIDDMYDKLQQNGNTAEGESTDPLSEITNNLYDKLQQNGNTAEGESTDPLSEITNNLYGNTAEGESTDPLSEITNNLYDNPQQNGNTAEGESTDPLSEITNDMYQNSEGNGNGTEELFQSAYDPAELSEKCHIVFHSFIEEDINEIINSVNDNLFKREMLERWIQLHEDTERAVHTLKEHLSYYLGKLKSLYSVDENIAEDQMRKGKHTIDATMKITQEYHNRLFFYYIIKDNLPESEHERFIHVGRESFTLFINELVTMEERELNKCVLE